MCQLKYVQRNIYFFEIEQFKQLPNYKLILQTKIEVGYNKVFVKQFILL